MSAPILPLPTSGMSAAGALLAGGSANPTGIAGVAGTTMVANGGNAASAPSTEGFIQVLDLLLSNASIPQNGSEAVANLFATTTFTATGESSLAKTETEPSDSSDPDSTGVDPLNPALCANIAALLQSMGFQVRPEQIAELKPMDREQLATALEFASRNLAKGTDSATVAENMSLLLPRPWPLDELNGSPSGAGQAATGATESVQLPQEFAQALDQARQQLLPAKPTSGSSIAKPAVAASAAAVPAPTGVDAKSAGSAVTPAAAVSASNKTGAKVGVTPQFVVDPNAAQTAQAQLQTTAPVATDPQAHHLVPGGTASEFIGRQVLEKVHVQLTEGKRELSLRLWPDELGEVRVSLRVGEESKVQAHIVVENESVRQAMLDSMPQLRDALSRHGMDLDKMSVSVNQRDAGSADSGQASGEDRGQGRANQGRNGRKDGFRDEDLMVATDLVLGRDTGRRNGLNTIDLWS